MEKGVSAQAGTAVDAILTSLLESAARQQ
eukprot:COSAG02_NODE_63467_length_263_cov_0.628049_1_plen_28_part_10